MWEGPPCDEREEKQYDPLIVYHAPPEAVFDAFAAFGLSKPAFPPCLKALQGVSKRDMGPWATAKEKAGAF